MQQQQMQQQNNSIITSASNENSENSEIYKMYSEIKKLKVELTNMKKQNSGNKIFVKRKNFDYKSIIQKLLNQVDELKKSNFKEKYDNILKTHNSLLKKYQILKKSKGYNNDINELKNLTNLEKSISENFERLKIKKQELEEDVIRLEKKEMNFNKRKIELDNLLSEHRNLLGKKTYQLEVMPNNFESSYTFNFNLIKNITSLKLISYSLPIPRYNIIEGINDIFSFSIKILNKIKNEKNGKELKDDKNIIESYTDDNNIFKNSKNITNAFEQNNKFSTQNNMESKMVNYNIQIDYGKYTIESLLTKINDKLKSENLDIVLNLTKNQLVCIESKNKILIKNNNMSNKILGIEDFNTYSNKIISTKCWDLRIPDRLSLYITNINENVPYGVLYFNNISISNISFRDPINLNKLDIKFLDSNGNNYNFTKLNHTLSFLVEVNENIKNDNNDDDANDIDSKDNIDNQNINKDNYNDNDNDDIIKAIQTSEEIETTESEYASNRPSIFI